MPRSELSQLITFQHALDATLLTFSTHNFSTRSVAQKAAETWSSRRWVQTELECDVMVHVRRTVQEICVLSYARKSTKQACDIAPHGSRIVNQHSWPFQLPGAGAETMVLNAWLFKLWPSINTHRLLEEFLKIQWYNNGARWEMTPGALKHDLNSWL